MNSSIINILEILKSAKSLNSLGFSSGYNFDKKNADEYFQELIQNVNPTAPIFGGVIILEASQDGNDFMIIDGLQRITTISLLLSVLCTAYKGGSEKNEDAKRKIFTRYLSNNNEVKLQLRGKEKKIYPKIVRGEDLAKTETQNNLFKAYESFFEQVLEKKISATKLFNIISRIQFMVVFTDPDKVPTRELYQSLNRDKDDLSQVKLITNFIAQKCGPSGQTWNLMVRTFKNLGLSGLIQDFIKNFLTIQNNGQIPTEGGLYTGFKNYFTKISAYQNPPQIMSHIRKYSEFYLKIVQSDFEDSEIQNQITTINENKGQDSYPYLMEVLDDFENNLIDREVFLNILSTINAFILKRNEDGPQDSLISFASLSGELNKMLALKDYKPETLEEDKLTINEINHLSTFEVQ